MNATLPHIREKMYLDDIIDDCLKGREKLVIVVSDSMRTAEWNKQQIIRLAESLEPSLAKQIRIYREGLEFDNGAKVVFTSKNSAGLLRGMRPTRIVVMGLDAEFWYLVLVALKDGAQIEAVA